MKNFLCNKIRQVDFSFLFPIGCRTLIWAQQPPTRSPSLAGQGAQEELRPTLLMLLASPPISPAFANLVSPMPSGQARFCWQHPSYTYLGAEQGKMGKVRRDRLDGSDKAIIFLAYKQNKFKKEKSKYRWKWQIGWHLISLVKRVGATLQPGFIIAKRGGNDQMTKS